MESPAVDTRASPPSSVLVTGAAGYVGSQLVAALARRPWPLRTIAACDVRHVEDDRRVDGVEYLDLDVCDPALERVLRERRVDAVVHLASIVDPAPHVTREMQYRVDVLGTRNVLACCLGAGVRNLIVTSSGAAYGYHADNPQPLGEDDELRGNREFAYADHKRHVEALLARYRAEHPALRQLVLRPCTVLGRSTANQIVALFEKPLILGVRGPQTPFVFVSDEDVVACVIEGLRRASEGVFNLAGDGTMTMREIAARIGKRYVAVPAGLLRFVLAVLHPLGLSRYGPEQVDFLRYRPVLSNAKLKRELGFVPRKTSREAFEQYWRAKVAV